MRLDHDPTAIHHAPHSAPPTRKRGWRRGTTIICVAVIASIGMATSRPELPAGGLADRIDPSTYVAGQVLGGGICLLLVTFAMAALVVGWKRSTWRLMPGTAFAFALLSLMAHLGVLPNAMGPGPADAQAAALPQPAYTDVADHFHEPPTGGPEANLRWVWREVMEDMTIRGD